jgi:hypothetical protein
MFLIFATKPLNDRTQGFRFNVLGLKGLVRFRKTVSRGYRKEAGDCTTAFHMGKATIYFEQKPNRNRTRKFRHFAG